MSQITNDQAAFSAIYGTPASTISFATLPGSVRRVDALKSQQLIHTAQPALPVIKSIFGSNVIDLYAYAFDTDAWEMGSTNSTIQSKSPVIRWNYDLSVEHLPGYTYLWLIAPASEPFSMVTSAGFYGVIPEVATEKTFFFSQDISIFSLSYAYDCATGGETWQGEVATWQGDAVTW